MPNIIINKSALDNKPYQHNCQTDYPFKWTLPHTLLALTLTTEWLMLTIHLSYSTIPSSLSTTPKHLQYNQHIHWRWHKCWPWHHSPAIKMMWIYPHKGYTQCRLQWAGLMQPFTYMVKIHTNISIFDLQPLFPLLFNEGIVINCLFNCSNLVPTFIQQR